MANQQGGAGKPPCTAEKADRQLPARRIVSEIRFEVSFSQRPHEFMQVLTRINRIDGMVFVTYMQMGDGTVLVDHAAPGGGEGTLLQVRLMAHGASGGGGGDTLPATEATMPPCSRLYGYYDPAAKCAKNKKRSATLVDGLLFHDGKTYLIGPGTKFAGLNKP